MPQDRGPLLPRAATQYRERCSSEAEELAPGFHSAHPRNEQLEVGVALDEVQVLGIDDEQGRSRVVVEEARVALGEQGQIILRDATLEPGRPAQNTNH